LLLAALHPKADVFLFKLLDVHMGNIVSRLQDKLINKKINEDFEIIIINVFGLNSTQFQLNIRN